MMTVALQRESDNSRSEPGSADHEQRTKPPMDEDQNTKNEGLIPLILAEFPCM